MLPESSIMTSVGSWLRRLLGLRKGKPEATITTEEIVPDSLHYDRTIASEIADTCLHQGQISLSGCAAIIERVRKDQWLEKEKRININLFDPDEAFGEYLLYHARRIATWTHDRERVMMDSPIEFRDRVAETARGQEVTPIPIRFPAKSVYVLLYSVVREVFSCGGNLRCMQSNLRDRNSGKSRYLDQDKALAEYLAAKTKEIVTQERIVDIATTLYQMILEVRAVEEETALPVGVKFPYNGIERRGYRKKVAYELLARLGSTHYTARQWKDLKQKANEAIDLWERACTDF